MTKFIVLDSGPLGLLTHSKQTSEAVACAEWLQRHFALESEVVIPEIIDYELRRELIRLGAIKGLLKLDSLVTLPRVRYLPIDTQAFRLAAKLWAEVRRAGNPTAHQHALDADVILAAQTLGLNEPDMVVATTNVSHISRFVPAALWGDIHS